MVWRVCPRVNTLIAEKTRIDEAGAIPARGWRLLPDRWLAPGGPTGSGACHGGGWRWRAASMTPYSTNTSSPNRDGTCGQEVVFCGSDQMLIRRFGSVPSHRLTLAFHTVPTPGGRRDSSSKFGQGMATSRLHPLSV